MWSQVLPPKLYNVPCVCQNGGLPQHAESGNRRPTPLFPPYVTCQRQPEPLHPTAEVRPATLPCTPREQPHRHVMSTLVRRSRAANYAKPKSRKNASSRSFPPVTSARAFIIQPIAVPRRRPRERDARERCSGRERKIR